MFLRLRAAVAASTHFVGGRAVGSIQQQPVRHMAHIGMRSGKWDRMMVSQPTIHKFFSTR